MADERSEIQLEIEKLSLAVDGFAAVMKARLENKALHGYTGWDDPEQVSNSSLATALLSDSLDVSNGITKGGGVIPDDLLVDVANRAMFLWFRGNNG